MATFKKVIQPVGTLLGALLVVGGYILNGQQVASLGLAIWAWQAIGAGLFTLSVLAIVLGLQRRMEMGNSVIQDKGRPSRSETKTQAIEGNMSSHEYVSDSYIRGRLIHLMDLLAPGSKPIISDRTIEDCEIRGPAMIALLRGVTIADSSFDGDIESLFVEVVDKRLILGAIGLQNSVFRRCRFTQIGIIGTREQIEKAKQGFIPSVSNKAGSQT